MKIPKSIKLNVEKVNGKWAVELFWGGAYLEPVWIARHKTRRKAVEIAYRKIEKLETDIIREWGRK